MIKMDKKSTRPDVKWFSLWEYIRMLLILGILTALPAIMYAGRISLISEMKAYVPWYLLYWAIVTAIICAIIVHQKHKAFDVPIKKLSEAAEKVAGGDFSVYLEPLHTADKRDYIDIMFEDFNKMVAELGSIETLKNDFIANVSHEIKTPLTLIRSYAFALKNQDLTEEERDEYADTVISAVDNLTALVTNILKLSKLENQGIFTTPVPYDLCRQLFDIAIAFEKSIAEKGIIFETKIDDRLMIQAEPGMLELVWNNLLSNAVKFTPEGGSITLSQYYDDDFVIVSISDTGCGMNQETMKHIFDKFYQGDTSHFVKGNGLGLALCQRVVDLVGGTISVESSPNEGSTFTVRIPI